MESTISRPIVKIGITGGIRSGKDTVAEYLTDLIGAHYTNNSTRVLGFADGITYLMEDYLPNVFDNGKPREAYQVIGQTMRRFDEDVWINFALDTMRNNEAVYPNSHYIVKDVRQVNEAKVLRELGFLIIKVTADKEIRIERANDNEDNFTADDFDHTTELSVDSIIPDIDIINDGTLEQLYDTLENILITYQSGESFG